MGSGENLHVYRFPYLVISGYAALFTHAAFNLLFRPYHCARWLIACCNVPHLECMTNGLADSFTTSPPFQTQANAAITSSPLLIGHVSWDFWQFP